MKNYFLITISLFSLISNSQTTIYETELNETKPVVKYNYLPKTNKIIIKEAFDKTTAYAIYNNALLFDINSKSEKIINDSPFVYLFTSLDESYFSSLMQKNAFSKLDINFYNKDKVNSFQIDKSDYSIYSYDFENDNLDMKPKVNFDFNFMYTITDEKGKNSNLRIEKNTLQLVKFDISKQTNKSFKIKQIDVSKLDSKDLEVPKTIAFQSRFYDDTFEIVTKSIKKGYSSSTLYRNIYDLEGKFIKEISYNYNALKGVLAPIFTNSRYENLSNIKLQSDSTPIELDINDYFIDSTSKDLYIYGITQDKESNDYFLNSPLGFYIIKFNANGNKIWEKFYEISDNKNFNSKKQRPLSIDINLDQFINNNKLVLSIAGLSSYNDHYNIFYVINKESGNVLMNKQKETNTKSSKGTFTYGGKYSIFENIEIDKSKFCDEKTILTLTLNEDVNKYINTIKADNDIFFNSIISKEGAWLLETDNKKYYKVTFFKEK
jgi:hypothetical protein